MRFATGILQLFLIALTSSPVGELFGQSAPSSAPFGASRPAAATTKLAPGQFHNRVFKDESGEHKYVVFVPAIAAAATGHPAILFLHGAGERGTDGQAPVNVGLGPYIRARQSTFPFVAIFPQQEDRQSRLVGGWLNETADAGRALKILDEAQTVTSIDPKRVSLIGWSMGGYGAWSIGAANSERFASVVALSGGGDPAIVGGLTSTPVWALHGAKDALIPARSSKQMVDALVAAGGKATYTEFPTVGHDVFAAVFGQPAFYQWLLKPDGASAPNLAATYVPSANLAGAAFQPVLDMPGSVCLRMGNDVLDALSYAASLQVARTPLAGRLADMFDSTVASGRSFSIQFSGLSYSGRIERVRVKAVGPNTLNVGLSIRDVTLSIGGTYVSGERHSAQTGPIAIYIARSRSLPISVNVSPYLEGGRIRFRPGAVSVQVPADDYAVSQPSGISVQGFGMTESAVSDGLTSGLYGARGRVENEIRNAIPAMISQLEQQIQLPDAGNVLSQMWPLPVYQPVMRTRAEQVSIDAEGVSLVLGVEAGAFNPAVVSAATKSRKQIPNLGGRLDTLPAVPGLSIALAPGLWTPLTQQLIDEGLARIDVLDIPEPKFSQLADREFLARAFPAVSQLPADAILKTELALSQPLVLSGTSGTTSDGVRLELAMPQVAFHVLTKPADNKSAGWEPVGAFDVALAEEMQADLLKPNYSQRQLQLAWTGQRKLSVNAPAGGKDAEIDQEKLRSAVEDAWQSWTSQGPSVSTQVPDIELGLARLRGDGLSLQNGLIAANFRVPGIRISNLSTEPFTYETKGPFSGWGGPYTLPPGQTHEYGLPYPLTYRRTIGGTPEVYSLLVGSNSEVRVPISGGAPRLFQARLTP